MVEDGSCEVFEVDLMDDTRAGWDSKEVFKGALTPLEELESFVVSFELDGFVSFSGISGSSNIDLDGVIND